MAKKPAEPSPIELLGSYVQDRISNFKGIATSICYMLSGAIQISVEPGVSKDGKMQDSLFFDAVRLKLLKKGPMLPTTHDNTNHIVLGTTAKDRVTEVEGTITEKVIHINGCTTVVLMRKAAKKDERVIIADWKRLDLSGSKVTLPVSTGPTTGGPVRKVERER